MYSVEIAPDVITLVGMPKGGTLTDGVLIGTVPVGHRPALTVNAPCTIRTSAPSNVAGICQINTNGNVNIFGVTATTSYVNISVTYYKTNNAA